MENKEIAIIEQRLTKLRDIKPDPFWQDSLRGIIVKKTASHRLTGSLTFRWSAVLIIVLLSAFLTGGAALLAQGSMPGDLLYPVKRNLEESRLAFAGSDDKLTIQQNLAVKRIAELKQIIQSQRYKAADPAISEVEASIAKVSKRVSTTSTRYRTLQQEGKDTSEIRQNLEQLVPVIEQKQVELSEIQNSLPESDQAKVVGIKNSLENLETQVKNTLEKDNPQSAPVETSPIPSSTLNPLPPSGSLQNTP